MSFSRPKTLVKPPKKLSMVFGNGYIHSYLFNQCKTMIDIFLKENHELKVKKIKEQDIRERTEGSYGVIGY